MGSSLLPAIKKKSNLLVLGPALGFLVFLNKVYRIDKCGLHKQKGFLLEIITGVLNELWYFSMPGVAVLKFW